MGVAVPPDSEFDIKCPSLCPRILISSHGDCPTVLILRVMIRQRVIQYCSDYIQSKAFKACEVPEASKYLARVPSVEISMYTFPVR